MLDQDTKRRIDGCRDILVGKIPDPKSQVEQITIALIYKFMDDMDREAVDMGGKASFFAGEYEKYSWTNIFNPRIGGHDLTRLYGEAIERMNQNPNIPQLFRDIFKNAYLPYRDPETLKLFLKEINNFEYSHSEKLGDAFEYLLSFMGTQGDAGQFRTPRHIIDFIVAAINPQKNETILDPACGTAGFLISAYKHIMKSNSDNGNGNGSQLTPTERKRLLNNFTGYDISPDMVRLSLVNLYLHGFQDPSIFEYDTLTSEERWNDTVEVILANPPFMTPKGGIRPHKRFGVQANRSEVLCVDYIAEHLNPGGRAGVIVPEGIIFQSSNAYKALRKMLVEDYLWAVVSLPAGVFNPYSGVKTSILLMDKAKAKEKDSILFIKVDNDGFDLGAQRRSIQGSNLVEALQVLKDGYVDRSEIAHYVAKSKIAESGDWNLSGERYRTNDDLRLSNYEIVELANIADVFIDGDWVERKDQSESGIRLIQTGNVGTGDYLDKYDRARFISEAKYDQLKCTEVLPGDVLISRLPDPVGRACIIPQLSTRMITAVDCTIIRFNKEKMLPTLFVNYTKTDKYYKNISQYLTGASRRRISRSNLAKVKIPLPPLSVQEEIMAEIDGYQKIIDGARMVVDNYKPTIKIDPEWEMVELGGMCNLVRGSSPRPKSDKRYYGGDVPRLMVSDVTRDGMYTTPNTDFLTDEGALKSRLMKKGEVVMAVSGNPGLPSILAIDAYIHDGFVGYRELNKKILPEYLYFILVWMKESSSTQSIGAVFKNLTTSQIRRFKIPLPTISAQRELVNQINEELKMVNANQKLIEIYEQKIKDKIAEVWGE